MDEIKLPEPAFKVTKSGRVFSHPDEVDCTGRVLDVYTADQLRAAVEADRQSQDREDAKRLDWLQQSDGRFFKLLHITSIVGRGFSPTNSSDKWFPSLIEAIDHARRIEGDESMNTEQERAAVEADRASRVVLSDDHIEDLCMELFVTAQGNSPISEKLARIDAIVRRYVSEQSARTLER